MAIVSVPNAGSLSFQRFLLATSPQRYCCPVAASEVTYDQFLQVKERLVTDPANKTLANTLYEYDLANNIEQLLTASGPLDFSYDALNRLSTARYPADATVTEEEQFLYDGGGNRIAHTQGQSDTETAFTTTLGYDSPNRITHHGPIRYRHNANGQRIEQLKQGVKTTCRYNPDHRLTAVLRNDVLQATYRYNPYGQRIRKVVNGTTTWFLYTPSGLTAEYDEAGNLLREYQFKPINHG